MPGLPTDLVGTLAGAITDVPGSTVEALVESLRHDMVCHDVDWTYDLLPEDHQLVGVEESFARALADAGRAACRPPSATRSARCRATRGGPAGRAAGWPRRSPAPRRSSRGSPAGCSRALSGRARRRLLTPGGSTRRRRVHEPHASPAERVGDGLHHPHERVLQEDHP